MKWWTSNGYVLGSDSRLTCTLRERPHYARKIWKHSFTPTLRPTVHTNPSGKRSFIPTVRPTVHTNPSRKRSFIPTSTLIRQNAALLLRLGLLSTPIRHGKGAFRKPSSNQRNLKTLALCFSVDGRHFENEAFRKRWRHDNHVIFLKHKSEITGDCCVCFKFFRRSVDKVFDDY